MMIINMIYLGLACLISHLSPSDHAFGVAETQHAASEIITTPLSIVAMPTTGRLLLRIPAIGEVAPASSNDNSNKAIDATTTPVVAQEPDGVPPIPTASSFSIVEARLNDNSAASHQKEEYELDPPSYRIPPVHNVLPETTGERLLLRLPSDPLAAVWAVDKDALYSFVREHEAAHTVTWNSDYSFLPAQSLVLPLTPKGRVLFRMPSSPALVDSVVEHVLLKFLEEHKAAEVIAYGDCDDYEQAGYYDDYEQADDATLDEDLQSATAIADADADSNTEEPTAQADESCGDDGTNATASTWLEELRIAILYRIFVIYLLWFLSTLDGFSTESVLTKQEQPAPPQPAPQSYAGKIQPFWDPTAKPEDWEPAPTRTVEQRAAPNNAAPSWMHEGISIITPMPRPQAPLGAFPHFEQCPFR